MENEKSDTAAKRVSACGWPGRMREKVCENRYFHLRVRHPHAEIKIIKSEKNYYAVRCRHHRRRLPAPLPPIGVCHPSCRFPPREADPSAATAVLRSQQAGLPLVARGSWWSGEDNSRRIQARSRRSCLPRIDHCRAAHRIRRAGRNVAAGSGRRASPPLRRA